MHSQYCRAIVLLRWWDVTYFLMCCKTHKAHSKTIVRSREARAHRSTTKWQVLSSNICIYNIYVISSSVLAIWTKSNIFFVASLKYYLRCALSSPFVMTHSCDASCIVFHLLRDWGETEERRVRWFLRLERDMHIIRLYIV